jgi:integrase
MTRDRELPTLAAWLEAWNERRRDQLRPHSRKTDASMTRNYVLPHLGDLRLDELDRRTLERTYARLLAAGGHRGRALSPKTVRNVHVMLKTALKDACQAGLLEANPAEKARPPRLDPAAVELRADPRVWTGEEAAAFLRSVDDHPWRALWHLAIGTGARRGELVGLRWVDVRLEDAEVRIRRSLSVVNGEVALLPTKTARPRVLCIADSVVDAMSRHRDEHERKRVSAPTWRQRWDLVFTDDTGGHVPPAAVSRVWRRLLADVAVPNLRFHDLRHTHASLLLALGVPMKVVSERLGHSTIRMTLDTYAHLLPGQDADAAARFERLLWSGEPGGPPEPT